MTDHPNPRNGRRLAELEVMAHEQGERAYRRDIERRGGRPRSTAARRQSGRGPDSRRITPRGTRSILPPSS